MNELINKNMVLEARIEAILDDKKVLVETSLGSLQSSFLSRQLS